MTAGHALMALLIGLALCFSGMAQAVRRSHAEEGRRTAVMRAVAGSIGMNSLAIPRDGGSPRQPMEGPSGGLGDIPAGYSLRTVCDLVTSPGVGQLAGYELIREQP